MKTLEDNFDISSSWCIRLCDDARMCWVDTNHSDLFPRIQLSLSSNVELSTVVVSLWTGHKEWLIRAYIYIVKRGIGGAIQ